MTKYRVLKATGNNGCYVQIGGAEANSAEAALRSVLNTHETDEGYASLYVVVPDHNWSEFAPELQTQMRLVSLAEALADIAADEVAA